MNKKMESKNSAGLTKGASSHFVRLDTVEKMIATAKDEVLRDARSEIDKQVQMDKALLITVFGIFASVLSFLTIEFSFFKKFDDLKSISGFSCILFSLLLGFNIGLDYLIRNNVHNTGNAYVRNYIIFGTIIFLIGILLVF